MDLLQVIPPRLQFLHRSKVLKHLVASIPGLLSQANGAHRKALVANVAADGHIIKIFDDPTGEVMSFVTSAVEFEGHLYLGNLKSDFIGKLPLSMAYT